MINRVSIAILLGLIAVAMDTIVLKALNLPRAYTGIPYLWPALTNAYDIAAMIILLRVAGGVSFAQQWGVLGLNRLNRAVIIWGLLLFVPAYAVLATIGSLDSTVTGQDLVFKGVAFPIAEEIVFRGLMTGILLVVCGWRFLAAALIPAIAFGLVHAAQGADLIEASQLAAITAAGSLLFGWLYFRWNATLWPPIILHIGLNSLWMAFALGDNAIGGWIGNGLRLTVVIAAIVLTLYGQRWLAHFGLKEPRR